jgi:hypothetical protein
MRRHSKPVVEQVAIIDDTKFFTIDDAQGYHSTIVSFDRDDGIFVYTLGADTNVGWGFRVEDNELHFTIEAIHGAFPAVEASITPDEPGINLVLDFGCDTLLS